MKKYKDPGYRENFKLVADFIDQQNFRPYSYHQFEQAFWHLWTLNVYHVTMSFDVNMVLLLDWAIQLHLELK